jgi:adenosylcobinamide-phosphate synthase
MVNGARTLIGIRPVGVRRRAAAAGLAIVVDRLVGEPPVRPHPVAAFGTTMRRLEDGWWADRRSRGLAHAAVGVGLGALVGAATRSTLLPTYVAVAGRALDDAAAEVEAALVDGDLDRARDRLPALVGRDPSGLDVDEIARAVVESLAENTVDAVVAPALWGTVLGGPGALGYRAVNTLDAMVGHRSARYERFGWASARLDDAANWVPARVAALLVALARPRAAPVVFRVVRRDAAGHPSPNGGVVESAFAAALGLRLGGPSRYGDRDEVRPFLGDGPAPTVADIARARRLARDVDLLLAALLVTSRLGSE